MGIQKDNKYKDNRKDIDFSFQPSQEERNEVKWHLDRGKEIPNKFQAAYLWLKENKFC
jgi:hypothetical protein